MIRRHQNTLIIKNVGGTKTHLRSIHIKCVNFASIVSDVKKKLTAILSNFFYERMSPNSL